VVGGGARPLRLYGLPATTEGFAIVTALSLARERIVWLTWHVPTPAPMTAPLSERELSRWRLLADFWARPAQSGFVWRAFPLQIVHAGYLLA